MTNASWTFTRSADPIPVLSVVGDNPRTTKLPVPTTIQTTVVYAPLCGTNSQMRYQWAFTNTSKNFTLDGVSGFFSLSMFSLFGGLRHKLVLQVMYH
jgi:hypothetical protein